MKNEACWRVCSSARRASGRCECDTARWQGTHCCACCLRASPRVRVERGTWHAWRDARPLPPCCHCPHALFERSGQVAAAPLRRCARRGWDAQCVPVTLCSVCPACHTAVLRCGGAQGCRQLRRCVPCCAAAESAMAAPACVGVGRGRRRSVKFGFAFVEARVSRRRPPVPRCQRRNCTRGHRCPGQHVPQAQPGCWGHCALFSDRPLGATCHHTGLTPPPCFYGVRGSRDCLQMYSTFASVSCAVPAGLARASSGHTPQSAARRGLARVYTLHTLFHCHRRVECLTHTKSAAQV